MVHHWWLAMLLVGVALLVLLPWPLAALAWVLVALAGLPFLVVAWRTLRQPVTTGREGMRGAPVQVVSAINPMGQVRYQGELWSALSDDRLLPGETARILGFEGLKVVVARDCDAVPVSRTPYGEMLAAQQQVACVMAHLKQEIAYFQARAVECEAVARRSLPGDEARARRALAQKYEILANVAQLQRELEDLQGIGSRE